MSNQFNTTTMNISCNAAFRLLVLPGLCFFGPVTGHAVEGSDGAGRKLLLDPALTGVKVLPQNWTEAEAKQFYNTTQGSQIMPYQWFLNLEQAGSNGLYRDAAFMRSLGYLPRQPEPGNPDGLPIGFVQNSSFLGLTCAACHTGQVTYQGTAWLIDGGPTMADAQELMATLEAALRATATDGAKFDRFATAVLAAPVTDAAKAQLRTGLQELIDRRAGYNKRNFSTDAKLANGPGRLDAFDAIFNEVAVRFAQVANAPTQCDAPVSYPFLWDTPQHDRVQWNGSAENTVIAGLHVGALGRNIGEVLGVFADVNTTKQEFPLGGYPSSVNKKNLGDLEDLLRGLWSPQWPTAFGAVDAVKAGQGAALYATHCAQCHTTDFKRDDPNRKVVAMMSSVGTDASMARNAAERKSPSGIFAGRRMLTPPFRKLEAREPVARLLEHLGQRVLVGQKGIGASEAVMFKYDVLAEVDDGTTKLSTILSSADIESGVLRNAEVKAVSALKKKGNALKKGVMDFNSIPKKLADKFKRGINKEAAPKGDDSAAGAVTTLGESDSPDAALTVTYQYKARPLNGIWATAPYLHNGSVLNLDELLKPAKERLVKFRTGSQEFDPTKVGLMNAGPYEFDTTAQAGNSNSGHEYGDKVFTADERAQLIEFMKGL